MRDGIYLFTGPNMYRMEKQLRAWQENFSEKYGAEQCIVYTPDSITLPHLKDALQ